MQCILATLGFLVMTVSSALSASEPISDLTNFKCEIRELRNHHGCNCHEHRTEHSFDLHFQKSGEYNNIYGKIYSVYEVTSTRSESNEPLTFYCKQEYPSKPNSLDLDCVTYKFSVNPKDGTATASHPSHRLTKATCFQ